jgi:heat shock protein HtpX
MALAVALNAGLLALLVGLLGWFFVAVPSAWIYLLFVGVMLAIGFAMRPRRLGRGSQVERSKRAAEAEGLKARAESSLDRLCLLAGIERPPVKVWGLDAPLSWISGASQVNLTLGLGDALQARELNAALAHEVAHLVNRDALVMGVLAGPSTFIIAALRGMWHDRGAEDGRPAAVMLGWLLAPALAWIPASRLVSRHREYAADRGAALLTGSPALLAVALKKVSDGLDAAPRRDLRERRAADAFNIVPVRRRRGPLATHPPLSARLAQLEALERVLQRKPAGGRQSRPPTGAA